MKSALRLRRPADFARARRIGKAQRHPALSISVCANPRACNRYGIVVGKHLGIAVMRNRIKRRLRVVLTELHPRLRQGFDIVVIARRAAHAQPIGEMKRILCELFLQARLIEAC